MATALEALEAAKAEGQPAGDPNADPNAAVKPEGDNPPADAGAAPPLPTFERVQEQMAELEKNATAGEVEKLRKQNEELILAQFPAESRPGVQKVLDLQKEATYVETERAKLDAEKKGMAQERILVEYKDAGVTADMLKHCPDETSMKEMAEKIKALGGKPAEGDEAGKGDEGEKGNPNAMKEPPAAGGAGGAPQTGSAEKFHRQGVEKGMSGLLGDFYAGQE